MTLETHQHPNPNPIAKRSPTEKQISMLDISEEEFSFIEHLLKTKFDFERDYIPESEEQKIACNKLTNRGAFDKNADGSYKITQAGRNMIFVQ